MLLLDQQVGFRFCEGFSLCDMCIAINWYKVFEILNIRYGTTLDKENVECLDLPLYQVISTRLWL